MISKFLFQGNGVNLLMEKRLIRINLLTYFRFKLGSSHLIDFRRRIGVYIF
jgi:hypothetical protein